jgi:hypothetical protein
MENLTETSEPEVIGCKKLITISVDTIEHCNILSPFN